MRNFVKKKNQKIIIYLGSIALVGVPIIAVGLIFKDQFTHLATGFESIGKGFENTGEGVKELGIGLGEGFTKAGTGFENFGTGAGIAAQNVGEGFKILHTNIGNGIDNISEAVQIVFSDGINTTIKDIGESYGIIAGGFSEGFNNFSEGYQNALENISQSVGEGIIEVATGVGQAIDNLSYTPNNLINSMTTISNNAINSLEMVTDNITNNVTAIANNIIAIPKSMSDNAASVAMSIVEIPLNISEGTSEAIDSIGGGIGNAIAFLGRGVERLLGVPADLVKGFFLPSFNDTILNITDIEEQYPLYELNNLDTKDYKLNNLHTIPKNTIEIMNTNSNNVINSNNTINNYNLNFKENNNMPNHNISSDFHNNLNALGFKIENDQQYLEFQKPKSYNNSLSNNDSTSKKSEIIKVDFNSYDEDSRNFESNPNNFSYRNSNNSENFQTNKYNDSMNNSENWKNFGIDPNNISNRNHFSDETEYALYDFDSVKRYNDFIAPQVDNFLAENTAFAAATLLTAVNTINSVASFSSNYITKNPGSTTAIVTRAAIGSVACITTTALAFFTGGLFVPLAITSYVTLFGQIGAVIYYNHFYVLKSLNNIKNNIKKINTEIEETAKYTNKDVLLKYKNELLQYINDSINILTRKSNKKVVKLDSQILQNLFNIKNAINNIKITKESNNNIKEIAKETSTLLEKSMLFFNLIDDINVVIYFHRRLCEIKNIQSSNIPDFLRNTNWDKLSKEIGLYENFSQRFHEEVQTNKKKMQKIKNITNQYFFNFFKTKKFQSLHKEVISANQKISDSFSYIITMIEELSKDTKNFNHDSKQILQKIIIEYQRILSNKDSHFQAMQLQLDAQTIEKNLNENNKSNYELQVINNNNANTLNHSAVNSNAPLNFTLDSSLSSSVKR